MPCLMHMHNSQSEHTTSCLAEFSSHSCNWVGIRYGMHSETERQPFGRFLESIVLISVRSTLHMKYLCLVVQCVFDLSRLNNIICRCASRF